MQPVTYRQTATYSFALALEGGWHATCSCILPWRIVEVRERLAMTVWNGHLSPLLDAASRLLVVDLEGGREVAREEVEVTSPWPPQRARQIADLGVDQDNKHYILTTNYVHASELHMFSHGPKEDGELIAQLLNEFFTEQINAYNPKKESS